MPDSLNLPKDRSALLVVFGIFTVLLGCVCGLFVPLMIFSQFAASRSPGGSADAAAIIPAASIYGILAVALIWLGIGSVLKRRWARALLIIFSWSWLLTGIVSMGFMALAAPHMLATIQNAQPAGGTALPPAALAIMLIIPGLILGFVFLVLPIAWVVVYGSRNVRATCEVMDPVMRWTDRCPTPLLAVVCWLAISVLSMLVIAMIGPCVLPFFGVFVSGIGARAAYLVLAGLWGWCAWRLYNLDRRAWWVVLVLVLVFMASSAITYGLNDLSELYRQMGYSDQRLREIEKYNFLNSQMMVWGSLVWAIPMTGYLICVRRFLGPRSAAQSGA